MENDKIEVYNYLDMHAVVNDNVIEVFSIKKLKKTFSEMDEFKLRDFEAEWRVVRQRMFNLKFYY